MSDVPETPKKIGRPKKEENCSNRSYQIPNELIAKIESRYHTTGIPRTTIVVQALTEHFEKLKEEYKN
jgi:acyl CoA:acetate/3-ketoacid CoA transferase